MYIRYTFIYYIYEVLFKLSFSFSCPFPFPFPFQYKTGAYLLQMGGVTLRWHTPRLRLFNRGWRQDHRNLSKKTGGPKKKPWKMEQHKPKVQVKTYMELSNTRMVHTSCIWGRQNCRKQTGGPKQNMENGAAQAKSEDQNIHGASNTRLVHTSCIWGRQNCRKHTGGPKQNMENGAAQAKSAGQNIHGTFQYKTGAYFLHMGEVTLRWHTPL